MEITLDAERVSLFMSAMPAESRVAESGIVYAAGVLRIPETWAHEASVILGQPDWASAATKRRLKEYVAQRRWVAQAGGTRDGVATSADARSAVAQAIQSIDIGIVTAPISWKTATGFAAVSRADLVAMANAMARHVQACFDRESALCAAIDAGSVTTTLEIDSAQWGA